MSIDIATLIASAMKDPGVLASIIAQSQTTAPAAAPVAAAAVTVNAETGKITLPKTTPKAKGEREDARIPETIVTIANDEHGRAITLGFSKTMKDERGKSFNYGFGVEHYDDNGNKTMSYMTKKKWDLLAKIAPLVSAAIAAKYE